MMKHILSFILVSVMFLTFARTNPGELYSQLIHGESFQESPVSSDQISMYWTKIQKGSALGAFFFDTLKTLYPHKQSQVVQFLSGDGEAGICNAGHNGEGINLVKGKSYEGVVRVLTELPVDITISLLTSDGLVKLAEKTLKTYGKPNEYQRLEVTLFPSANESHGRLAITLRKPCIVTLGYVFLQPGAWGRYKNLPATAQGAADFVADYNKKSYRFNASMPNGFDIKKLIRFPFKWKNLIGPRDLRFPLASDTDRLVTCGWGVPECLNLCELTGITAIPGLSIRETTQDVIDFVEYVNGTPESKWGKKRVLDGHPAPYRIKTIEIGTEFHANEELISIFKVLVEAIRKKDSSINVSMVDWSSDR